MTLTKADAHSLIGAWYTAGLSAVEPRQAVSSRLGLTGNELQIRTETIPATFPLPERGVTLVAIGKAAVPMAQGARDVLRGSIREGVILTKDGHAQGAPADMRVFEAAHPIPDERGVAGTAAILDMVSGLDADDVVVTLVSGGGSALFEAPRPPLTLADMQTTTNLLLRAGAPIQDLNAVRSPLSLVKGGGFRQHMGQATCVTLILSDVLGNDPSVIASGPTIRTKASPSRALAVLEHYGVREQVPASVIELLERQVQEQQPVVEARSNDVFEIVGDNDAFVDRVAEAAKACGLTPSVIWHQREGEAREIGRQFVVELDAVPDQVEVVLGGGEATVTVKGDGVGGRNTEFALAAAIELHRTGSGWVVASLASDGQDGLVDGAGAIADATTVDRAIQRGIDPVGSLDRNDSGSFFKHLSDLVVPGPTGTNVNDVFIAVRSKAHVP